MKMAIILKEIVSNLKPNLVNKKNYTISQEQVTTIKDYISNVEDTTKSMKKVNDLDIIIKEYEKDLKDTITKLEKLNSTIRQKDEEIRDLTQNLDIAKILFQNKKKNKYIKSIQIFMEQTNEIYKRIKLDILKTETYKNSMKNLK